MARQSRISIDSPLLTRLKKFDKALLRHVPSSYPIGGLYEVGLMLVRPTRSNHWCTPGNSLTFASTGADGTHFSFIAANGIANDRCPIVMTRPMEGDEPNIVVGESLFDFLCLGCRHGYRGLETAPSEGFFALYKSLKQEGEHAAALDEYQTSVLESLTNEFSLIPWKGPKTKYQRMQREFMKTLELPNDG